MWLRLLFTFGAIGGGIVLYVILQRHLGWVELWHPLRTSKPRSLAEVLPLEDIQNECYIMTDGSLVAGWELTGIDGEMRSEDDVASEVSRLGLALNLLDPDVEVIVQVRRSPDISLLLSRFERVSQPALPIRLLLKKRWAAQLKRIAETEGSQFLDTRVYLFLRAGGEKRGTNPVRLVGQQLQEVFRAVRAGTAQFDPEVAAETLRADYVRRLKFLTDKSRSALGVLDNSALQPRRLGNEELNQYAASLLWSARSMSRAYVPARRAAPNRFVLRDLSRKARREFAQAPGMADLFPQTLRSQIASVTYEPFPDYVVVDGRMIGVMRMTVTPDHVFDGMLVSMRGALQFPWCYTMRISPRTKQAELDRLRKVADRAKITANTRAPGSSDLDAGNLENASEAQQRYDDARDPSQQLFGVELTITYDALSHDDLLQRANDIAAYWLSVGDARLIREEYGADRLFRESLPFGIPRRNPQMTLFTAEVTALAPVFTPWQGSREPVRVFRTTTGEPWGFDPVDRHLSGAQHAIVTGKTGSGKGVIWQLMVIYAALLKGDCDVLILDSGATYRRAAAVLGGHYFEASADSPEKLNAYYIPPAFYRLSAGEQAEFLTAHIETGVSFASALARPRADQAALWEAVLGDVITVLIRQAVQTREEVLLRHVVRALLAYTGTNDVAKAAADGIATQLKPYIHDEAGGATGGYAAITDMPQTFDGGTSDFIVVDFNKVAGTEAVLSAFIVMAIGGLFWQRVLRNKTSGTGRYTRVVFDETPKYLTNPRFTKEIRRAYREFRKFGGIVDTIAQSWADTALEEFKEALTPVKENSTTRVFLSHDRSEAAAATLRADGLERLDPKIFELQRADGLYSEAIVSQKTGLSMQYADILVVPDPLENWLATTNPDDTSVETTYWKRYGVGTTWNLSRFELTYLLAQLWPNSTKNPATVTGIGLTVYPSDALVREIVTEARAALDACQRELEASGRLRIVPVPAPMVPTTAPMAASAPRPITTAPPVARPAPVPERAPGRIRTMADLRARSPK